MRHIAQEHSYVKDMWKRITNPDISHFSGCILRNKPVIAGKWTGLKMNISSNKSRVSHARENADFYLDTTFSTDEVLSFVKKYLEKAIP